MLLPFFLLRRKAGSDMLTAFWRVGRPFGAALTAACGLFCVYMAASTAGHFSFFLVSTVYQNAKQWVFVLLFLLAAAYAAALGLEAFSRAGGFFFAAAMAAGALLLFALLPEVDLANLANPFLDPGALAAGTLRGVAGNADILLFLLLFPRVRGGSGKTGFWWVGAHRGGVVGALLLRSDGARGLCGHPPFPASDRRRRGEPVGLWADGPRAHHRVDHYRLPARRRVALLRLYLPAAALPEGADGRGFRALRPGGGNRRGSRGAAVGGGGSAWESGVPLLLLAVAAPLVTLCFPRAKSPVEDGKEAAQ